jgi:Berberine and berberine like
MSLYEAYLKSLDLALKRDIRTDTFVIKRTVSYLEKVVSDIHEGDAVVIERLKGILDSYLELDIHITVTLDQLFGNKDFNDRIYQQNLSRLQQLKEKIDSLLLKTA